MVKYSLLKNDRASGFEMPRPAPRSTCIVICLQPGRVVERKGQTAQKFAAHPHGEEGGERLCEALKATGPCKRDCPICSGKWAEPAM